MTVFRLTLILLTGEEHFYFGFVFAGLFYFNHCVSKPCK